jgi:hypothetical protein
VNPEDSVSFITLEAATLGVENGANPIYNTFKADKASTTIYVRVKNQYF